MPASDDDVIAVDHRRFEIGFSLVSVFRILTRGASLRIDSGKGAEDPFKATSICDSPMEDNDGLHDVRRERGRERENMNAGKN